MEKSPLPITDSIDISGITIRKGYSFRVMPVKSTTTTTTTTVLKPEVIIAQNPSEKITPITIPLTTKKPIKL